MEDVAKLPSYQSLLDNFCDLDDAGMLDEIEEAVSNDKIKTQLKEK